MSWYDSDCDRWPVVGRPLAVQTQWTTTISCQAEGCDARAVIEGYGASAVYSRTALWVTGWRQRPGTRLTWCPDHAGASACP